MRRISKERKRTKQIAQTVTWGLILLITGLLASVIVLMLSPGMDWWPRWLVVHRSQAIGILLFAITILILLSPIIVEATSNTRRLSGPGKTYSGNRLDEWHDELKR